ncbi:MAG: hypothetical protein NC094_01315 [Bacteroidales bacterium]|nr:hypothetical protein [Lachnoclostridium sp.]MCM1384489.1 hypothetical protein [Lachnoclostridium sp.]MCM1464033.1 hypothetical protein [Bacteroidales bacterium]
MVNFFKKKGVEEVFAGGRVIVTDFGKLKKGNYPQYADMLFMNYDGKIYLDSMEGANEAVIMIFKMLVQYSKAELRKFEKERRKKYPDVKVATDLARFQGDDENFMNALAMLLIPVEIQSRETQRAYYGII